MATVIERERPIDRSERYVEIDRSDNTGGWIVAVVLLALLALGVVWWLRYQAPAATPASNAPANINVTVPGAGGTSGSAGAPGNTNTGGSGAGGGTSGTGTGGSAGGASGGSGTTY
jgi:hypothetical protein